MTLEPDLTKDPFLMNKISFLLISVGMTLIMIATTPTAEARPRVAYHWPKSTVYVENHAGGRWPVRKVAENLDNGSSLNLVVVKRCPKRQPCIRVRSVGNTGRNVGQTSWDWVNGDELARASVRMNDGWGRGASRRERLSAVCHELGHAVGLRHASSGSSCMRVHISGWRTKISRADRRALDRVY